MEKIKQEAELYAESFRYKIDDAGWYEQKVRDFIAGYEAALRIHEDGTKKEMCPKCFSLKNEGEGKGMFPVFAKHYVCCDCGLIFHTLSDYYLRRYKEITGKYWNNGK